MTNEQNSLKDKAIIVTGSTTGIGEATVRLLASNGARVLVHGRDEARARTITAKLKNAAMHIDNLADPEAPTRIVQAAIDAFGRIDGVINNAAWVPRRHLMDTTAQIFDDVFAINARAPMLLIQAAHKHLKKSAGSVVNIGSINAWCGEPSLLAYSMSKGALMTMSKNLADALGKDGIRVNHLNVGWVLTEMEYQKKLDDGLEEGWPDRLPKHLIPITGKMTTPEQVAQAAAYWISPQSYPYSGVVCDLEQYPFVGRNPDKEDS